MGKSIGGQSIGRWVGGWGREPTNVVGGATEDGFPLPLVKFTLEDKEGGLDVREDVLGEK